MAALLGTDYRQAGAGGLHEAGRGVKLRLAAELDARLRYTGIDEILDEGLHEWLNEFIPLLAQLGSVIHTSYLEAA